MVVFCRNEDFSRPWRVASISCWIQQSLNKDKAMPGRAPSRSCWARHNLSNDDKRPDWEASRSFWEEPNLLEDEARTDWVNFENSKRMKRDRNKWPLEIHSTAELIRMQEVRLCGLYRLLTRGEARLSSLEKLFRRPNSVGGWSMATGQTEWTLETFLPCFKKDVETTPRKVASIKFESQARLGGL